MAINQNWKLGRRSSSCHHSSRPFVDGESIVTAVIPVPDSEEFERRDYAVEAWDEIRSTVDAFSFWRTKFEVRQPEVKKSEVVEKESAESLLRRLIEEDDPKTENARFILAVMLERKRTLKEVERKDTENGSRLLIYEHPKTGDVLIVRDPMLRLDEIEPVQEEVSALLAPKPAAEPEGNSGEGKSEAAEREIEEEASVEAEGETGVSESSEGDGDEVESELVEESEEMESSPSGA